MIINDRRVLVEAILKIEEINPVENSKGNRSRAKSGTPDKKERIKRTELIQKLVRFVQAGISRWIKHSQKENSTLNVVIEVILLFTDLLRLASAADRPAV